MDALTAEIVQMEIIRDALLAMSWEGRRRAIELMTDRFIDHPRCSDNPEGA